LETPYIASSHFFLNKRYVEPYIGFIAPPPSLKASYHNSPMNSERPLRTSNSVDMRPLKEKLRKKLPSDSPVLADLLREPDSMTVESAEVLIPHYLRRLERELSDQEATKPLLLRE
jgi:hypothetical protein